MRVNHKRTCLFPIRAPREWTQGGFVGKLVVICDNRNMVTLSS